MNTIRLCKCGSRAISHDGLCAACILIRDEWKVKLATQRRYDGRCKRKR